MSSSWVLSAEAIPRFPSAKEGAHGAVLDFYGVVRGTEDHRLIRGITYSAYLPMAEKEMQRLWEETAAAYPGCRLFMQHRLGFVPAGEASVLIRTEARHSLQAYEANQKALFTLKKSVPIWKEIVFEARSLPGHRQTGCGS